MIDTNNYLYSHIIHAGNGTSQTRRKGYQTLVRGWRIACACKGTAGSKSEILQRNRSSKRRKCKFSLVLARDGGLLVSRKQHDPECTPLTDKQLHQSTAYFKQIKSPTCVQHVTDLTCNLLQSVPSMKGVQLKDFALEQLRSTGQLGEFELLPNAIADHIVQAARSAQSEGVAASDQLNAMVNTLSADHFMHKKYVRTN